MDRQDIDALLIGALYGELTPADEARLQAHLESHPGDRSALDDLKTARQAVRESRVFDTQAEPPQAVSAMLLQEAARRAPRRVRHEDGKEGWLTRFMRSFVMHPAMAAAATLVLVIGVAGTLYMTKGSGEVAEPTKSQGPAATEQAAAPATPPAEGRSDQTATLDENKKQAEQPAADPSTAAGAGSSAYRVNTYDGKDLRPDRAELAAKNDHAGAKLKKPAPQAIIVNRPEPQPKDLDRSKSAVQAGDIMGEAQTTTNNAGNARSKSGAAGGGAGTTTGFAGPSAGAAPTTTAPAPPPPPVAQAPAKPSAAPPKGAPSQAFDDGAATPKKESAKNSEDVGKANSQLQSARQYANNGDCTNATKVAMQIREYAPEFYNTNVITDRALKQCGAYLNDAAEKAQERSGKARASKKAVDSAPAPATEAK